MDVGWESECGASKGGGRNRRERSERAGALKEDVRRWFELELELIHCRRSDRTQPGSGHIFDYISSPASTPLSSN